MTRKIATIRKDLAKVQIAVDKAMRAVFALSPRTDVRFNDICEANKGHPAIAEYNRLCDRRLELQMEARAIGHYNVY